MRSLPHTLRYSTIPKKNCQAFFQSFLQIFIGVFGRIGENFRISPPVLPCPRVFAYNLLAKKVNSMLQCHADLCVSFQGFSPVTPLIAPCTYVHRMSLRGGQWPTWQSVSPVLPWLPLWRSCHEVTERVNIALSAPAGHLSHGERQAALIRHSYAVPPSPRGRQGERIATPVCGLVRNDSLCRGSVRNGTAFQESEA